MDAPWHEYQLPRSAERQRPPPPRHTGRSHSLKNEEIPQILASPPSHKSSLKWSSQHRSIFIILKIFMSCWVGRLTLWSSLAPLCCYQVQPGEILWKSRAERNLFKYKVLKVSKGSMIYWLKIPWYIIPRSIRCIVTCNLKDHPNQWQRIVSAWK